MVRLGTHSGRGIDNPPHIETASRAYDMGWCDGAAFGADRQITGFQRVVGSSFVGAAVGVLAFWDCHDGLNLSRGSSYIREGLQDNNCTPFPQRDKSPVFSMFWGSIRVMGRVLGHLFAVSQVDMAATWNVTGCGKAWLGKAWLGKAWLGKAWRKPKWRPGREDGRPIASIQRDPE